MNAAYRPKPRVTARVAQDQPFDELLGHRIVDRFFDGGCFASFALAHQIDRLLDRRKVAGQRGDRRCLDRRIRLTPRRRDMRRMLALLERGVTLMPDVRRACALLAC